ncbi:MAG TPA: PilZ domain-containing protein [Terriglobia bacterium]|nr:PilZ domain-containing protein [Terriglobia bacterium]
MAIAAERRRYRRYDLSLEVHVKPRRRSATPYRTVTRDISARGVYFDFSERLEPGSELEFELTLPPELVAGRPVRIRCRGKIVRVDAVETEGAARVAATIESYEFIRAE